MRRLPSFAVFRHRPFRALIFSRLCVTFAEQIQLTAMGWQIYDAARDRGHSIMEASLQLGFLGLAQFLPLLALSLVGGNTADRFNRRHILLGCYALYALIALTLVLASGLAAASLIPVLFTLAVTTGAVNAFFPAALSAALPMTVPREDLPVAIPWNSLCGQAGIIIGPALGGLLYGISPAAPYAAGAFMLVVAFCLIAGAKIPKHAPAAEVRSLRMIVEGLRFVWSNKIVLGAMSLDLIVVLLAGAVALLPVFARDILHAGPSELGLLRSSMGVGAVVMALLLTTAPLRRHIGRWMFVASIVFGAAIIVFARSTDITLSAAALMIAGAADMVSVYVRQSLIQLATPDAMRGRVAAVSSVFVSASNELGDFESGLMARIFGPVLAATLGGAGAIAASALWMKLFPALRQAEGFELRDQPTRPPRDAGASG